MRSNIDIIKKALYKEFPTYDVDLLVHTYFRFLRDQLQNPTKPEITIGYLGRLKFKPSRGREALRATNYLLNKIEKGEYTKGVPELKKKRLEELKLQVQNLLDISSEMISKGKIQTSPKRKKNESKDNSLQH